MTFWIVPLLWECQTMKRNTVISALVGSVSSQFHGLLSLQYVSTQKQKVISSAGSHSAFSLGQHFPLPSGPPNWPRIPGAAVSMERLQSQGGWCSVLSLTELCYSSQFLTLPGPTLPPLRTGEHRSTAQSHCSDLRYSNHLQSLTGNFYGQVCSGIQRVVAFRKWIFDISESYGTAQICSLRQKPFDVSWVKTLKADTKWSKNCRTPHRRMPRTWGDKHCRALDCGY